MAGCAQTAEGRFSRVKQAVPVSQVVMFDAQGHTRGTNDQWVPVTVRCGYQNGMMLAYELLDANGATIGVAGRAAPVSSARPTRTATSRKAGATKASAKASSKSTPKTAKSTKAAPKGNAKSSTKSATKPAAKKNTSKTPAR
jgi:hypothetical protein